MNNSPLSFLEIINLSTEFLQKKGVPNPKCDVEWIVSFITNKKRVELYLEFETPVELQYQNKIREFVIERGKREFHYNIFLVKLVLEVLSYHAIKEH